MRKAAAIAHNDGRETFKHQRKEAGVTEGPHLLRLR
jgi:hypothetical protein